MKDHRMNMEDITGLDIDKILESEYMNGKYTYRSRNPSNHSSPEANGAIEDLFDLDEAAQMVQIVSSEPCLNIKLNVSDTFCSPINNLLKSHIMSINKTQIEKLAINRHR